MAYEIRTVDVFDGVQAGRGHGRSESPEGSDDSYAEDWVGDQVPPYDVWLEGLADYEDLPANDRALAEELLETLKPHEQLPG